MKNFIRRSGWHSLIDRPRHHPKDSLKYLIPEKAIDITEGVLDEYCKKIPSNEGLVYWAGSISEETVEVRAVIAPETISTSGRVSTSYQANIEVIRFLSQNQLILLGQVHSHPGTWVDHSTGDDLWAPYKFAGMLSLVVPEYCRNGMSPITLCGVHRFEKGGFIRFTDQYVSQHFKIFNADCIFKDLRSTS